MASTDAVPIPRKNTAYRVTFAILDADGDPVTGATGLDSEVSKDAGAFADCTNEATEISQGVYYLDLTSTEMNADTVAIIVKTTSSGAKSTVIVLYPEEAGDVRANLVQWNGTAPSNLVSGRVDASVGAMANDVVTAAAIATGAIDADAIADDAIDAGAIADAAIDAATFAAGAITASAIAADAIGASELAADAVAEIADAVWDEARAGHVSAGSFGEGVVVASVAAGAITAGAIATDAIGAAELAADAVAEIADAVWDEARAGHVSAGSFGEGVIVNSIASNAITASAIATDAIDADALAADAGTEIADAILKRDLSAVTGEAARSMLNALRFLRNRWRIASGTLTVYKEDDTTSAWSSTVTTTAGNPVSESDPA